MRELENLTIVDDSRDQCVYLSDQTARMPLCLPPGPLSPEQLDRLLAHGYRRSGWYFYRTRCPSCSACQPLRIDVDLFKPSRSQRRANQRGEKQLRVEFGLPTLDSRRLDLFNQHRQVRQLARNERPVGPEDYRGFLLNSFADVGELSLWFDDLLVGVSITDIGQKSLSAVYCFFDPAYSHLSIGTYAILQQIFLARQTNRQWLYLGMYVANNSHLNYKSKFGPHEKWIGGRWQSSLGGMDGIGLPIHDPSGE
ncbi:MAG: arginyltransferase [Planctomycetales bacterium]|nr:arginyltransferase [Planctomycetales bacterium]